jgi:AcrR family transcriptional regulator
MAERTTGVPASIEAAWGVGARPARGPRRELSLERIVAAGVRLAEADGLVAVSMARVAAELGASTMALYRYVAAKDELLTLMIDHVFGVPPAPMAGEETWRDGLRRWAWGHLEALHRHPWVLHVPLQGPPATPNQLAWMEHGLSCLAGTGLAAAEQLSVILLLSGYVRNNAAMGFDIDRAFVASGASPDEMMAAYSSFLLRVLDPVTYPHVVAVLSTGVLDQADPPEDEFTFGLDRVLDGVEVLVRARRDAGTGPIPHDEPGDTLDR